MVLGIENSPSNPEDLEMARKELRETPENIQAGMAELRELLKNDDTIYFKDDDETLTIFLRPCKWYAKSAYELVSKHFVSKNNLCPAMKCTLILMNDKFCFLFPNS